MDNKILEILIDMQNDIKNIKNDIKDLDNKIEKRISEMSNKN